MNFKDEAQKLQKLLVQYRRDFHSEPELPLMEYNTCGKIKRFLAENNIEILPSGQETSVVGIIRGARPGKTIGLRADIDALPITEAVESPYKSKTEGVMHACGHDAHSAMLMGAALLLNSMKKDLKGCIKLIFQAAEEIGVGALNLVKADVLEGVDAVMGFHINMDIETGKVGFKSGYSQASASTLKIVITGAGGHGAFPHKTNDPITAGCYLVTELQTIVSRMLDPVQPAVITIGSFQGGTKENIIPEKVDICGTIRTFSNEVSTLISTKIADVCRATELVFGCKCEFTITTGCPPVFNNPQFVKEFARSASVEIVSEENVIDIDIPAMVGDDMAFYLEKVPGVLGALGVRNAAKGITAGNHTAQFDLDEESLWVGTACLAQTAWDFLAAAK
ncbi:MAG: M20 family metallopeptidase [Peptococcaceae bacterium]|nr:M20 family metallopeptidase [Peptococcaceae bacterium]